MTLTSTVTNLELRESNPDGTEGAGLSHTAEGLFLLHVLEVADEGEPKGCVTVVHDAGGHGQQYRPLAERLARTGWAVALPDLRGHGRSEGARGHSWGIREAVRDIESVQDHLAYRMPEAPKVVVGLGLGGLYALRHALDFPDRVAALVLLSPTLAPPYAPPPEPKGLKGLFSKPQPTDAASLGHTPERLTGDPAARSQLAGDELRHDAISRHTLERLATEAPETLARAGELSTPALVLHGADDEIADPERTRTLAGPTVEVRVLDGKRHDLLMEEGAERIVEEVASWIDART